MVDVCVHLRSMGVGWGGEGGFIDGQFSRNKGPGYLHHLVCFCSCVHTAISTDNAAEIAEIPCDWA